jgi:hypothetical protein
MRDAASKALVITMWALCVVLTSAVAALAADWHVDAAAAPGGSGSTGAPFQSVHSATDVADPVVSENSNELQNSHLRHA